MRAVRAMVLSETGPAEADPLRPVVLPDPAPGAGEVLLEVEACGVCRTDLHLAEGEVPARLPVVPGHQAAGRVAAVGEGVSAFRAGDSAGVGWMGWTCGACRFCRSERENLCPSARCTGRDRDGGFAERLVADARWVFPLPAGVAPREAAPLLCAGIIGYRALRLSGIRPGGRLGLFGFGASAHLAIQIARHWECDVYAFTREPKRRELAKRLGAVWTGDVGDDPGTPLDAAVTFAPAGPVATAALSRLDRGGVVAVNAIHASPIPSFPYEALYGERTLTSVMNSTRADAAGFLALAAAVPVRAEIETFPLAEANRALQAVKSGALEGAAVLLPER